jgi:hypothetical protein
VTSVCLVENVDRTLNPLTDSVARAYRLVDSLQDPRNLRQPEASQSRRPSRFAVVWSVKVV